jgi:hypothetical protein
MIDHYIDIVYTGTFWAAGFGGIMGMGLCTIADRIGRCHRRRSGARLDFGPGDEQVADDHRYSFMPRRYLSVLLCEPLSVIPFFVGGWYLLWQDGVHLVWWWGGGVVWRILCDLILLPIAGTWAERRRCLLLKLLWCLSSGASYAAMSCVAWAFIFAVTTGGSLVAADRDPPRRRRRW